MVTLQAEDEDLAPVIQWLQENKSPELEELRTYPNVIRNLWAQRADLQFQDEVLVRITPSTTQLVVPQTIRRSLFDHVHSGPLAAHLGS